MPNTKNEVIKELAKLNPKALEVVGQLLEHRANLAMESNYNVSRDICSAYELLMKLVDDAHTISLEEECEAAEEARIIDDANTLAEARAAANGTGQPIRSGDF